MLTATASLRYARLAGIVTFAALIAKGQQTYVPGKFYEYYIVARTGSIGNFTALGSGPSIDDARQVAFQATTSSGTSLWIAIPGLPAVNFNPGESNSSDDIISGTVRLNDNLQVVSEDRITTTEPATTNIRLYNALSPEDSFSYIARGGPGRTYDAVFPYAAVNSSGDVVFSALHPTPNRVLALAQHDGEPIVEMPIITNNPKPMIADDGTVVINVGANGLVQPSEQIFVYPPYLQGPYAIAATTTLEWDSLDNDPGISHDGLVVAFQGNLNQNGATALVTTPGPGIFVAINEGSGFAAPRIVRLTGAQVEDVAADRAAGIGNFDGICDPGEICKPSAELGYDDNGNPITIASYGADSRVGVMNVGFGAAGIDDDTFVVSFIATPSSASRDNPAFPGFPLLFSAQQGLWTIRVDVTHQLAGTERVYHVYTPIPVVQVGDNLGGNTITAIGVYDPIAMAAYDESANPYPQGKIRTMRRGDHCVAFWASTNNGQFIARANHLDSDQDGLLDHWETTGIDMNQDGQVDLKLSDYGADPFTRDLFVQVDWVGMPGSDLFKPAGGVFSTAMPGAFSLFVGNLQNAEGLTGPMYGATIDGSPPQDIKPGIIAHVDAGFGTDSLDLPMSLNLNAGLAYGGNYVGMTANLSALPQVVYFGQPGFQFPGVNVRAFQDIKDNYMGRNDKDARLLAFHYALFAPFQNFIPNYPHTPYGVNVSSVPDANHVEVDTSAANLPVLQAKHFLLLTSGAASDTARQIVSITTDNQTGNAVFEVHEPFNPLPGVGDGMTFLDGSGGLSEVAAAPPPDNNSWPGNDLMVNPGALGVLEGVPPNACMEGETLTHELGHTLGLRHGGIDRNAYRPGATYKSIMSYSWELGCNPGNEEPDYSQNGDPTFDDYGHLLFNFSDVLFQLSTTLGTAQGQGYPDDLQQDVPEMTLADKVARDGPLDTIPPTVSITSPAAGASVIVGGTLVVAIQATDNVQVASVSASFDTNGDGTIEGSEQVAATQTAPNTYQASFAGISGSPGNRQVSAIAWDTSSNSAVGSVTVSVVAPSACDLNDNGNIGVSDIQKIVNEALGLVSATDDLDGSGAVNAIDVQIEINAALYSVCEAK
jgi:hypothetical protein